MVAIETVRRLAMTLPEVQDLSTSTALKFDVRGKAFAWSWNERIAENRPRCPRLEVLALRCPPEEKEAILSSDPQVYFTDDHYRGYPAILVRLDAVTEADLVALLTAAWRCRAPRALVNAARPDRDA